MLGDNLCTDQEFLFKYIKALTLSDDLFKSRQDKKNTPKFNNKLEHYR